MAEIELFYLFSHQRRWKTWFPDVMSVISQNCFAFFVQSFNLILFIRYYHANVDETRRKIKELIKEGEWNFDEFSEMKQNLLNKLNI